ncbi:helix-turn-helix transcriptional regulator [Flavonifractor sp. An92]|uniref:helix-turn-helix domain-containing protein n=1 Tax=Flavonifractor sp. An92 TaxID=1965666 RepID=UPI001302BAA7|nr:helix-turn-helix transcriptional regulator [Flavonifractor sp. An92]
MKELRLANQKKQDELAELLDLSYSAYKRYEYGEREPTASTIVRMARYFNVSSDYLLGLRDEP